MKNTFLILCVFGMAQISLAQTYLPLTGGTLSGQLTGTTGEFADRIILPSSSTSSTTTGQFGFNSTVGTYMWSRAGSSFDYTLYNGSGATVLNVPTGTVNTVFEGDMSGKTASFVNRIILPSNSTSSTASGQFGYNSTVGTYMWSRPGSSFDYTLYNGSGATVFNVPTGTVNAVFGGALVGSSGIFNDNLSIGTIDAAGYKLAVNGIIRAKEIKVETGWADFVLKPDYKLRSLKETKQFIKENGHLPEIPSAKDVEENGINLGEMNAKLLQKIEELTLHLIKLNEKVDQQQMEIKGLKTKL